jgi:nucleoside-diphosphate-sugar epimerase
MNGEINKVVITGGCGFIGGHLSGHLAEQGYEVTVVDDNRVGKFFHDKSLDIQYRLDDVVRYCEDTHFNQDNPGLAFIHLANTPRVRRAIDHPAEAIINNISSTAAIAQKAARLGVPLFFAQSSSTLFADKYSNAYTWSKVACDEILDMFGRNYGLEYTNMYFYNVYGPGEADYGPYSTVVRKFKQAWLDREPVKGIAQMLVDDDAPSNVHLGKGSPRSVMELAEAFDTNIVHAFDVPGEAQDTLCKDPYIECPNEVIDYIYEWTGRNNNERGS